MHFIFSNRPKSLTEVPLEDRRAAPEGQRIGVLISQDAEGGLEQHIDLIACCHCQRIFPFVKGSGRLRGWCLRCNKITCGPGCEECVPWRQMLASMEAGMTFAQARRHRPIMASVPDGVPQSPAGVLLGSG